MEGVLFYFLKTFPKCFAFALGLTVSITSISSAQPIASEAIEDVLVIVDPAWVIETDGSGRQWLQVRFDLENRSDRPITAWQIRWLYGSPSGDRDEVMVSTRDLHLGTSRAVLAKAQAAPESISKRNDGFSGALFPGQLFRYESGKPEVSLISGNLSVVDVEVTMVVFADGEALGDLDSITDLFEARRMEGEQIVDTIALLDELLQEHPRPTVEDVESFRRNVEERVVRLRAMRGESWEIPRRYSVLDIEGNLEELEHAIRRAPGFGREIVEDAIMTKGDALITNRLHTRKVGS